ncbi:serine/threonine-protein kinase [Actinomadura sp. 21ATH]|uniref:serine/threonine-protein kinase n=1 Tax=Actinomadura sp. 21ATH TaxID=1735444 RepID=UPI0035BEC963
MTEDVPGYRVLEQVGEGGFSVVYRAHQERLDRMVALKVLSISAVDDGAMRRFQRECKITGRLSGHPNVVTVLDTGSTRSGRPYIAMEYFEHGALSDRLAREGPLPVADVLRIGVKMAGALAATHDTDVLHRDVKPQNILVSGYGEPALADFGIARLVDSFDASHTQAFTPHHAAPEVLEGRTPGVGADIYSLGSTLYQLLAGQPAFKGPPSEGIAPLMLRILNDPPPPIRRRDVPPSVTEAVARAMAKAPEQRYAGGVEFARHLQRVQGELGLPVTEIAHSGAAAAAFPSPSASASTLSPPPADEATPPAFTHPKPPPVPDWAPTLTGEPGTAGATGAGAAPPSPWHPAAAAQQSGPPPAAPAPAPAMPQAQPAPPAPGWPPPEQGPDGTARKGDGPRRGLLLAASVAVVGGLTLGIGALALRGGPPEDPRNGRSAGAQAAQPSAGAQAPGAADQAPIPAAQYRATRPRGVKVKAVGPRAVLVWQVPPAARELPMIVQVLPAGSAPAVSAGKGARSATVTALDPRKGYCFRVGALLRLNQDKPATMSWSKPAACVRGARVQN